MTDLIDEIKASFEKSKMAVDNGDGVTIVRQHRGGAGSGFPGHAGALQREAPADRASWVPVARRLAMPTDSDELMEKVSGQMTAAMIALSMSAFADGVILGHQSDPLIKMMFHFNNVDHVFHDESMRREHHDHGTRVRGGSRGV